MLVELKERLFNKEKGKDGIELPEIGDILVWYVGHKYPVKGYSLTYLVEATATIKRIILEGFRFLASKPIRYFLPLLFLLPKSAKQKIITSAIRSFLGIADRIAVA